MANMLSAVDLSDMSAENIRAARAIDIDFACERYPNRTSIVKDVSWVLKHENLIVFLPLAVRG